MFAQKRVNLPPGRHKVVILDEADRCVMGPVLSIQFNESRMQVLMVWCDAA